MTVCLLSQNSLLIASFERPRATARKISIRYAGYCDPGPLRPPFVEIPAAVDERARRRAAYWTELCAKYRPQVEGLVSASR